MGSLPTDKKHSAALGHPSHLSLWPDFIEKELELTHDELSVYMDKQFAHDERFLQKTRVAPCLLQALGECHTYPLEEIQAAGPAQAQVPVGGLSDLCLDIVASILINATHAEKSHFWMPAALATAWFHGFTQMRQLEHWALAALHGHLFLAVAKRRHWILLDSHVKRGILHVIYLL